MIVFRKTLRSYLVEYPLLKTSQSKSKIWKLYDGVTCET